MSSSVPELDSELGWGIGSGIGAGLGSGLGSGLALWLGLELAMGLTELSAEVSWLGVAWSGVASALGVGFSSAGAWLEGAGWGALDDSGASDEEGSGVLDELDGSGAEDDESSPPPPPAKHEVESEEPMAMFWT